jgi:Zn-finger nucleic acid-binding protein
MRLLVACPFCKRQYDASHLTPGQQFRCQCGHELAVQGPRHHEAAVVCCSHCGAPRTEGALSCPYCGADYTLHERDLDTVCPHCFARVGNSAKFCQFCGAAIHPEATAGETSQLVCPSCGEGHFLISRACGSVSAMECQRCCGMWLSPDDFRQLIEQAAKEGQQIDPRLTPKFARPPQVDGPPSDGGLHYRHCAICQQVMTRQNYGHGSGVIIDVCGRHGVWLDADDLPRILEWIHEGGLVRTNQEAAQQLANEEAKKKSKAAAEALLVERNIQPGNTLSDPIFSDGSDLTAMAIGRTIRLLFVGIYGAVRHLWRRTVGLWRR